MSAAQGYTPVMNPIPLMNPYTGSGNLQSYEQQTPTQYHSVMQQPIPIGQQSPAISSTAVNANVQVSRPQPQVADPQWPQGCFPYPYQSRDHQQFVPSTVSSVPYPFGQLPYQPGMQGGKAAHPLPGSFSRQQQQFNPQTRAFIPNSGQLSSQTPLFSSSPNASIRNSSIVGYVNGNQYNSYPPQNSSNPQPPLLPMSGAYYSGQESKSHNSGKSPAPLTTQQSNGSPVQNSLSKWGVPANLPPKPPPPEPSMPDNQHSLPMNNQFNVNVQPLNGGQPMPSYHNGVYSMPGVGPQS